MMGQRIQLRRVRSGMGQVDMTMPTVDLGPFMPTDYPAPPPLEPVFTPVKPPVPTSINIPIGPMPSLAPQTPAPTSARSTATVAPSSWMDQQWVSGVQNKYLVYGGAGILLLAGMRKSSKGYRRR